VRCCHSSQHPVARQKSCGAQHVRNLGRSAAACASCAPSSGSGPVENPEPYSVESRSIPVSTSTASSPSSTIRQNSDSMSRAVGSCHACTAPFHLCSETAVATTLSLGARARRTQGHTTAMKISGPEHVHGQLSVRVIKAGERSMLSHLVTPPARFEARGSLLERREGRLVAFLECVAGCRFVGRAERARPVSSRHCRHRGVEAEHVAAAIADVAQYDLLLVMAPAAQLAHQRVDVVRDLHSARGRSGRAPLAAQLRLSDSRPVGSQRRRSAAIRHLGTSRRADPAIRAVAVAALATTSCAS